MVIRVLASRLVVALSKSLLAVVTRVARSRSQISTSARVHAPRRGTEILRPTPPFTRKIRQNPGGFLASWPAGRPLR